MLLAFVLALQVATPTPTPTPGYRAIVVLRDGTRFTVSGPYNANDRIVAMRLADGSVRYVSPGEIDQPKTKQANAPAVTPTPAVASAPKPKGAGTFSAVESTAPTANRPYTLFPAAPTARPKTESVSGYTRQDGTHVESYKRAKPSPRSN